MSEFIYVLRKLTKGYDGRDAAIKELSDARARYKELPHKA